MGHAETTIVCVNVSPSLRATYRPLWRQMTAQQWGKVRCWDYQQGLDEGADVFQAVDALSDYLRQLDRPVHLLGHGLSGAVGWWATAQCPQAVQSLSLLAVHPCPTLTWHSHYYVQRHLMPCSQEQILLRLSRSLFGDPLPFCWRSVVRALAVDLEASPSPHSLWQVAAATAALVPNVPLFIGGSADDPVVVPEVLTQWPQRNGDCLWIAPQGRHFFHLSQATALAAALVQFWQGIPSQRGEPLPH
ncbi:MAG: hypothetical protein OHK0012_09970 [Synechococcales cyanobacterium]